jgi:hypothetical protein
MFVELALADTLAKHLDQTLWLKNWLKKQSNKAFGQSVE